MAKFQNVKPPSMQMPKTQTFDCGIHDITYREFKAGCPVCHAERTIADLRAAAKETRHKLEAMHTQLNRLQIQTDIVLSIREAATVLGDEDLVFFKTTLYQWRDQKSVALKTTHGRKKGGKLSPPNGFIVIPRKGDPYGHSCSSIGGMAIAEYFDEAVNTVGPIKAMEYLVKGLAQHLPGAST